MNNFNKLTENAQQAIIRAQAIAQGHSSSEIDNEHLLAALLEDDAGVPVVVLRQLGIDVAPLRRQISALLDNRAKVYGAAEPSMSRELRDVLARAADEALKFKDEFISTEHLLLAIASAKGRSDAAGMLIQAGATNDAILKA
ncbi:MAG: type VI secretion system ATPase TssH, partial [Candidatus Eremiobacteraeota bacterium]|nr:type VI secretion system ATPase TssH [Candidatus Eremiobacteraeota bacterium]